MGSNKRLTAKQEKFVQELIKGKSQREAYKTAYPSSKKWKAAAIDTQACILLTDSKVAARYTKLHDRLVKEAEDECIITAKELLTELANIARSNGTVSAKIVERELPVLDNDGNPTGGTRVYKVVDTPATETLAPQAKSAIAGIEQTQTGIKIRQYDKLKAIELLGKHLGMFADKQEVKLSGTLSVEEIIKKVEGEEY